LKNRKERRLPKTLADLSDVLAEAAQFVARVGAKERFLSDPDFMLAGEALINRIGDIVGRLPSEFHAAHPEIDWSGIIDTRVLVAHHYERIEHRLLWKYLSVTFPDVADKVRDELPEPKPLLSLRSAPAVTAPRSVLRVAPGNARYCEAWMPVARTRCALPPLHAGHHRSVR
jgi:uncharacterized protein with HEPN domain